MSQENAKPTSNVKRLNIVLAGTLVDAMDETRSAVGATSRAELIKNAARFLISALEAEKRGEKLVIKSPDGTHERVLDIKAGLY